MPHIELPPHMAGIRALMAFRPETAAPLNALVDTLLRGAHTLTPGERELIATCVSAHNDCTYCRGIHGAVAAQHLGCSDTLVDAVVSDPNHAEISEKLKALLAIAVETADSGRSVTAQSVARARAAGANDIEIHDTVLIAAAFCMFNRYVDGLATWAPGDRAFYRERAAIVVRDGYAVSAVTPSAGSPK